jgi:hypothetical protein
MPLTTASGCARNVLTLRLGIQSQHPKLVRFIPHVIDDTKPASFSHSRPSPPRFPNPTRTRNNLSDLGVLHQELLQLGIFIVIQVCGKYPLEDGRFDECKHATTIRHWRTEGKATNIVVCLDDHEGAERDARNRASVFTRWLAVVALVLAASSILPKRADQLRKRSD